MKRIAKKITACFVSAFMLCAGTCAAFISASAANDAIQSRLASHRYGDVNDDGAINIADVVCVLNALNNSGKTKLSISDAAVYLTCPQAADVNGDGSITNDDATMIQNYILSQNNTGRCGQIFYII
ncbi:MAG: dockerin type I repeat-containing protein [Oscillospiraceae bacterium]|nr:dockerin type I repeat-containing protein [Oscillospiraceae bacterium]